MRHGVFVTILLHSGASSIDVWMQEFPVVPRTGFVCVFLYAKKIATEPCFVPNATRCSTIGAPHHPIEPLFPQFFTQKGSCHERSVHQIKIAPR